MLLRGVLALATSLDLPPAVAPTLIGYSDDPAAVLSVPSVDHVFNSSRSGQHYTDGYTDAHISAPSVFTMPRV